MDLQTTAFAAAVVLLATLVMLRMRQRGSPQRPVRRDNLDTVMDWPPESVRVLTIAERQSYELLRKALPGFMVLAQVPLSRFVRVPTRHSHAEWMQRVGALSADLVVCDSGSRVLAVIDVRAAQETERSRRRHDRMARVLKAANIKVYTWREDALPSASQVRSLVGAELTRQTGGLKPAITSKPMPLIPVAEMEELLSIGDRMHEDPAMEPVPSAFFDEPETAAAAGGGRRG